MEKKYELIPSDIDGMYRIRALRAFNDVKVGDIGGYVRGEHNLSQSGNAWVYDNALVYENARIYDNALVYENAWVYGNAKIHGNAKISDNARIYGNACVYNNTLVFGDAQISGSACVYDNACVFGNALVYDDAKIHGNAKIHGDTQISGDAKIKSDKDYIVFKNFWDNGRYFTWTRSNDMYKVGCFYGTGKKLIEKAYKDSKESGYYYKAVVEYVEAIKRIGKKQFLTLMLNRG